MRDTLHYSISYNNRQDHDFTSRLTFHATHKHIQIDIKETQLNTTTKQFYGKRD